MEAQDTFVILERVGKEFPQGAGASPLTVLRDICLEIRAGESAAIVGPSGSGKSTLLNIIGGLDQPGAGRVLLEGEDLSGLPPERLAEIRNTRVGFVFQSHHLLPQCTAFENVLVPKLARGGREWRLKAAERGRMLLDRVGLGSRLDHFPGELSGGERQRVAVVRALINQPALLLADEPTGALDRASAQDLAQLLAALNREERVTLIVATHAPGLAALMGRVYRLSDGQLVCEDNTL
jgi:ABC-type lipoprotein export system ATPase subunit